MGENKRMPKLKKVTDSITFAIEPDKKKVLEDRLGKDGRDISNGMRWLVEQYLETGNVVS